MLVFCVRAKEMQHFVIVFNIYHINRIAQLLMIIHYMHCLAPWTIV